MSQQRLTSEFQKFTQTLDQLGIQVRLVSNCIMRWKARMIGPKDTLYQGGVFLLDIHPPLSYPFVAPRIKFETPIWHPNISPITGSICLDITDEQWSPSLTIKTTLLSIQSLLDMPECQSPMNLEAAEEYQRDKKAYKGKVREWVEKYARREEQERKQQELEAMGFGKEQVYAALVRSRGEVQGAKGILEGNNGRV